MSPESTLRPLERRVLQLVNEGVGETEIARRFKRSPDMIRRVIAMAHLPRAEGSGPSAASLRPLERRVLRWRDDGVGYGDIASRFRRSSDFVERVEAMARYKLRRD